MDTPAPVLIAGQGLAGTLLARELERRGRGFVIVDPGHAESASRVGAGLVNPVTGERWVAAPGWAEKAAGARAVFHEIEREWGLRLVTALRVRREWRSEAEGALVRAKALRGELAPWIRPENLESGAAWIEGAWRVDLPALIAAGRDRWGKAGKLREARVEAAEAEGRPRPVVWCVGAAETRMPDLRPVGGETLELEVEPGEGWREDVVRHDGAWILPLGGGRAWAGATFVRDEAERATRREELRASVRRQLADLAWREAAVLSGRRMTSPDRAPKSGWLPGREGREGVLNGLGSKGALLAPALARAWAERLAGGA
jgi:glycine oxidase